MVHWGSHLEASQRHSNLSPVLLFEDHHFDRWLDALDAFIAADSLDVADSLLKKLHAVKSQPRSVLNTISCFGLHQIILDDTMAAQIKDWNQLTDQGVSPLYMSARWGHLETMKCLIDRGAKIDTIGGQFGSALQASAYFGHKTIVKLLLSHGSKASGAGQFSNPIHAAVAGNNEDIAVLLLAQGIDFPDSKAFGDCYDLAVFNGQVAIVQMMLEKKVGPARDLEPLHSALFNCRTELAKKNLTMYGDINRKCGFFGNALQAAICGGSLPLVQLILDQGASLDARGTFGFPLRAATVSGHYDIVKWLLEEKGADPNIEDADLGDCLQAAASKGHNGLILLLLEHKANADSHGGHYGNPLQAACFLGHLRAIDLLLKHGAGVNTKGRFENAFEAAATGGHDKTWQHLANKKKAKGHSKPVVHNYGPGILRAQNWR